MRRLKILLAVVSILVCSYVNASDVTIVANVSVKANAIAIAELRRVFMGETNALQDGSHVEPVFERSGATHEAFLREFLNESQESLENHYGSLVFTGKALMPKSFNSDADVLKYVSRTRGAIGYVTPSANTEGVKVLEVLNDANSSSGSLLKLVQPEYPETLRKLKITGTVRLQVIISPEGTVESVTLLGGNPILGEAAIKAVKQWIYNPGHRRTAIEVTINFSLPD